jgi:hypothetical protein
MHILSHRVNSRITFDDAQLFITSTIVLIYVMHQPLTEGYQVDLPTQTKNKLFQTLLDFCRNERLQRILLQRRTCFIQIFTKIIFKCNEYFQLGFFIFLYFHLKNLNNNTIKFFFQI